MVLSATGNRKIVSVSFPHVQFTLHRHTFTFPCVFRCTYPCSLFGKVYKQLDSVLTIFPIVSCEAITLSVLAS
ncbi:hypothetical protein AHAS_Ahas13G0309800 [Arachis hypogaea]